MLYQPVLASRLGRGRALVRVRAWLGLVCVLLSGARLPGLLRGVGRAAAVPLPSSGVTLGFGLQV